MIRTQIFTIRFLKKLKSVFNAKKYIKAEIKKTTRRNKNKANRSRDNAEKTK